MESNFLIVLGAAVLMALTHTILAPNHYLPFIMIGKTRNWGIKKTVFITMLCSLGHLVGALIVAVLAVGFGIAVSHIEIIEGYRANIAAWGLIIFGLGYFLWGIRAAYRDHHCCEHIHTHKNDVKSLTPFILFMIFLFAPCEAVIPVLLLPALQSSPVQIFAIALAFGVTTMAVMVVMTGLGYKGIEFLPFKKWEKYGHAITGLVILICGILVEVLEHAHHHIH